MPECGKARHSHLRCSPQSALRSRELYRPIYSLSSGKEAGQHRRDYIAGSASIPDTWRGASEPFSKIEEDPNHGWFREQFVFMKEVPRSRYEFVLEL